MIENLEADLAMSHFGGGNVSSVRRDVVLGKGEFVSRARVQKTGVGGSFFLQKDRVSSCEVIDQYYIFTVSENRGHVFFLLIEQ